MVTESVRPHRGRASLVVFVLMLALVAAFLSPATAVAVKVGYYDMVTGAGIPSQVPPITAAGHTAVQLTDLQASDLSGVDVIFVQDTASGSYGAEYLSRLAALQSAVSAGKVLLFHDQYIANSDGTGGARTILPGGSGFTIVREVASPAANDVNVADPTSPAVAGVAGTLTDSSLDNGAVSSGGYADLATLPATAKPILWRPDPGNPLSHNRIVAFAYPYGNGAVIYSTIPLGHFLTGTGVNPPADAVNRVYAPNVINYAALLSHGSPDLAVTITDGQAAAIPGSPVTYTIQAQNPGVGAATGAALAARFPAALAGVTWTCAAAGGATCASSGQGDISDLPILPVGGTAIYTATGTVSPAATGTLSVTATIQSASGQMDPVPVNNTATDTDTLTPLADLALTASGPAGGPVTGGATVTYTLTAKNAGPSDASAVSLSDPTPPGLTLVSASSPCAGGFPCNIGGIGTLAAGGQATVTVTFSVPSPYLGPNPVVNLAALRGAPADPAPGNNLARAVTPATGTAAADLKLTASGPPSAAKGSTVTFTLQAANLGTHDAAAVVLQQTAPTGLFYLSATAPCAGGFPCNLGTLNAGGQASVRVTFGIPSGYAGADPIVESASVASSTADPSAGNNAASAAVPVGADTADLAVTAAAPTSIGVGANLAYTFVVTNRGPAAAANVVLAAPTPTGLTFATADAPCAGGFPCNLGGLPAGQSATVRATFQVPTGYGGPSVIQETASVTADTPEGNPGDNSAVILTGLGGEAADLVLTASAPTNVAAGSQLAYTLSVVNRGPGVAHAASLQLSVPGGLTLASATGPCSSGFPCNLGDLPPGAALALGALYQVAPNHVIPNPLNATATVSTTDVDPVPGNNSGSVSTGVVYRTDLAVTQTDGRTSVAPGMTLTYTITVANQGPSSVAGATVDDAFPANVTGAAWTCAATAGASCTALGSGAIHDTVNLAAGSSLTYTANVTVVGNATGTIANTITATVPGGVSDPVPGNNSATDSDAVLPPADLAVQLTGPASAIPGTSLTYTLKVTNNGTGTATSVVLTDPTPSGLTFSSAGAPCAGGFPCSLPDLAPGQSVQLAATYAVPAGYSGPNPIASTATVTTATPESHLTDNSAAVSIPVVFSADLSIAKTNGRPTVVPGESVTYTITVGNAGPSNATGATVSDTPPAVLRSPAWTCAATGGASCGAASSAGGTGAIADVVNLPVGGGLTYTLTATVDPAAGTAVVNQASVSPAAGAVDPVPGNNLASATSGLAQKADLGITLTDGLSAAVPGQPVTYTLVVTNAGPSSVSGITVSDPLPAALLGASWTCTGSGGGGVCPAASGTAGNGSLSQLVSLPAGGALTYQITATVDPGATGTLANTATVAIPAGVADPSSANNSATDSEPLTRVADLTLTESGPGRVDRGATLTLTLDVANAGPSAAAVTLTSPAPPGLTLASAGAPCAGGFPCNLGTLAPGADVPLTVTYTVPADYAGADPLLHLAAVESDAADPRPADDTSRSATAIGRAGQANLALAASAPSVSTAGSTVTYILTVTNQGLDDALGVDLDEAIPAGLTFVSATSPCAAGFHCNLGTLAAGSSRSVQVTLAIPAGYSGPNQIVNSATVKATTPDPDTADNTASATTTLVANPTDLAVTLAGPPQVAAGQDLVYTLTVTNRGPATATNTRLTNPTPSGLAGVSASAPCAGGFPCFLDTLASGQTATVQATFHVPTAYAGPNPIVDTASVTANELDGQTGNNQASFPTGVGAPAADLAITKSGPAQVQAGSLAGYLLLVRNLGPGTATAVTLADPTPANTTFVSASAPCASGFPCSLGNLPPGSAVAVVVSYRVRPDLAQGTKINNTATVSGSSIDPQSGNNSAVATTGGTIAADLGLVLTDNQTELVPGRTVTYTITVANQGPSDAPGTRVIDHFPSTLSGVTWTCAASAGSSCVAGASGSGDLDRTVNLATGGTIVFTASGTVQPGATGTLANTATVQPPAAIPDPVAGNNSSVDTDTLKPQADLAIAVTDGAATAVPGKPVTYTITVTNQGPSDAPNANVADTFPVELSNVLWTCIARAGSACTASGSQQILDTVQLKAGGTAVYTVNALLSPATTQSLADTATVTTPAGLDPVSDNDSATDTDTLARQGDLSATLTDGVIVAIPGTAVTYRIVVANAGPSDVTGATVTDLFPPAVTAVAWTCAAAGGANCGTGAGSGNLQQTVDLPAGSSLTYQATATLNPLASGTLVDAVTVASPTGATDPAAGNNSATDSDTLSARTDLSLTITGPDFALPGSTVAYTITVGNAGPSGAKGAAVADLLPATLSGATWTCTPSGGATCAASGSGNLQDTVSLPPSSGLIYQLTATFAASATGTLANTASVAASAGATDPVAGNNSATATSIPATGALRFHTLAPCRAVDTRNANGPQGGPAFTAGVPRTFQIAGTCGVPATARAVAVNLTVTQPGGSGSFTLYPAGNPAPVATALNFATGQTRTNNGVLLLGPAGGLTARATLSAGTAHFILDVMGYFE